MAPEHLEIITENAMEVLGKIRHAGAIFIGRYSSEPVGDYFAGPNHVFPTNGTARFSSPLMSMIFKRNQALSCTVKQALVKMLKKLLRLPGMKALKHMQGRLKQAVKNKMINAN